MVAQSDSTLLLFFQRFRLSGCTGSRRRAPSTSRRRLKRTFTFSQAAVPPALAAFRGTGILSRDVPRAWELQFFSETPRAFVPSCPIRVSLLTAGFTQLSRSSYCVLRVPQTACWPLSLRRLTFCHFFSCCFLGSVYAVTATLFLPRWIAQVLPDECFDRDLILSPHMARSLLRVSFAFLSLQFPSLGALHYPASCC